MVGVGADPRTHSTDDALEVAVRRIITGVRGLVGEASRLEPGVRVKVAQIAQRELAAMETSGLADMKKAGASDRDVQRRAAAGGTRSRKESSKQKRRADAVGENPDLAKKLGDGDLGEEHVDA